MAEDIEQRVIALEHEVQHNHDQMGRLVDKLDTTIDKLTEVSYTIGKLLAEHETTLKHQEKRGDSLQQQVSHNRQKNEEELIAVHRRLDACENEIKRDVIHHVDEKFNKLDGRLAKIERFVWIMYGMGIIVPIIATIYFQFMT